MQFQLRLSLPHEAASVSVVRAVTRCALEAFGASASCAGDVELAVSEACTNVVEHAGGTPYNVAVHLTDDTCRIEVTDQGAGMPVLAPNGDVENGEGAENGDALRLTSERGRGIALMRALVDRLDFEVQAGHGTKVSMEKSLNLKPTRTLAAG